MTFTSLTFLAFLLLVWLLYFPARHRQQNRLLLVASYVFYAWWDWRFLALLVLTSVVDFTCGRLLGKTRSHGRRKGLLLVSIGVNLGVLGFFKYFDFFVDGAVGVLHALDMEADLPTLGVILPVGISFYTFQSMSYTIDVFRRKMEPTEKLTDYLVFVAFFPQLVAGPIMRASALLPQCTQPRVIREDQVIDGI